MTGSLLNVLAVLVGLVADASIVWVLDWWRLRRAVERDISYVADLWAAPQPGAAYAPPPWVTLAVMRSTASEMAWYPPPPRPPLGMDPGIDV